MKKWALSAILYLVVVVTGYTIFSLYQGEESSAAKEETSEHNHTEKTEEKDHHEEETGNSHDGHGLSDSEVNVELGIKDDVLHISLTDATGKAVSDLEINHEKYMHVIVVDQHLDTYQHIHPNDLGSGEYEVPVNLQEGNYKVFVDIKPKDLSYTVQPIPLSVGNVTADHVHGLQADTDLTQEIDGKQVTLNLSSQKAGEPVTLDFELDTSDLEPYLGAMGHVVILDEKAEHYLHVHPENSSTPVFGTQFDQAGIYKIWAEFKQSGKVRVFPFVVEIK